MRGGQHTLGADKSTLLSNFPSIIQPNANRQRPNDSPLDSSRTYAKTNKQLAAALKELQASKNSIEEKIDIYENQLLRDQDLITSLRLRISKEEPAEEPVQSKPSIKVDVPSLTPQGVLPFTKDNPFFLNTLIYDDGIEKAKNMVRSLPDQISEIFINFSIEQLLRFQSCFSIFHIVSGLPGDLSFASALVAQVKQLFRCQKAYLFLRDPMSGDMTTLDEETGLLVREIDNPNDLRELTIPLGDNAFLTCLFEAMPNQEDISLGSILGLLLSPVIEDHLERITLQGEVSLRRAIGQLETGLAEAERLQSLLPCLYSSLNDAIFANDVELFVRCEEGFVCYDVVDGNLVERKVKFGGIPAEVLNNNVKIMSDKIEGYDKEIDEWTIGKSILAVPVGGVAALCASDREGASGFSGWDECFMNGAGKALALALPRFLFTQTEIEICQFVPFSKIDNPNEYERPNLDTLSKCSKLVYERIEEHIKNIQTIKLAISQGETEMTSLNNSIELFNTALRKEKPLESLLSMLCDLIGLESYELISCHKLRQQYESSSGLVYPFDDPLIMKVLKNSRPYIVEDSKSSDFSARIKTSKFVGFKVLSSAVFMFGSQIASNVTSVIDLIMPSLESLLMQGQRRSEKINSIDIHGSELLESDVTSRLFTVTNFKDERAIEAIVKMFNFLGILEGCNIQLDDFVCFLLDLRSRFSDLPYHNWYHAIDSAQFAFMCMTRGKMKGLFTHSQAAAIILGALCHDIEHDGLSSKFHVKASAVYPQSMSLTLAFGEYNPLERSHFFKAAKLIEESFTLDEEFWKFFNAVFDATSTDIIQLKPLIEAFDPESEDARLALCRLIIKCANVASCTRPFDICKEMAMYVYEEFKNRTKLENELGLTLSTFVEGVEGTDLGQNEVAFITGNVAPLFSLLSAAFPETSDFVIQIQDNRRQWIEYQKANFKM